MKIRSKITSLLGKTINRRLFVYSDETSFFHEIENAGKKIFSLVISAFFVGVIGTFSVFLFISPTAFETSLLERENSLLREQISGLNVQVAELNQNINQLSLQGNQLRMLVDLPALDKSSQQAGTGGAVPLQTAKNGKGSDEGIIERVTQLRHQLDVQEQSFREIRDKFDYNKKFFASIPALKPMDGYYSPTGFGIRMHPVYGMYKTHVGLDIISNIGTPIYAAGDGVVEFAGRNNGGYGVMIEINHGFGYKTLYAHCSKILVKEGAKVKRGDLIAKSGKTGLVSGPHLHYEVTLRGVKQNPVDYFFDDIPPSTYNQTRRNQKAIF